MTSEEARAVQGGYIDICQFTLGKGG